MEWTLSVTRVVGSIVGLKCLYKNSFLAFVNDNKGSCFEMIFRALNVGYFSQWMVLLIIIIKQA